LAQQQFLKIYTYTNKKTYLYTFGKHDVKFMR